MPDGERFAQAMNGQFLCFAPISYVSPQNRSKFDPIYQDVHHERHTDGKLGEGSDKSGPITGNQAEASDTNRWSASK